MTSKTKQVSKQANKKVSTGSTMEKMTASEKINYLVTYMSKMNQTINALAQENQKLGAAVAQIDKRVLAIIQSGDKGEINSESVKSELVAQAEEQLKNQVDFFLKQGLLVPNNDNAISENSFIVGRELDKEGSLVNPRVQILVTDVTPELKAKLLDKKVGEVLQGALNEELSLEILENYVTVDNSAQPEQKE